MPIALRRADERISYFSLVTTVGTPQCITAQELRVECMFPFHSGGARAFMNAPLFVSERPGPQITTRLLSVGCLIFPQIDQIDFTGPFEVLSRMPDRTVHLAGKEFAPIRDVQGL